MDVVNGWRALKDGHIHLLCGECGRKQSNSPRQSDDPKGTVVVRLVCDKHSGAGSSTARSLCPEGIKMMNNEQPEPPVDFAGAARIFFRQTQKLIDTVAELERKEIQQIVERHRDERNWRAGQMAGAAKDLELVKAECCEVILEDVRTKGSWANLPATPVATSTHQSSEVARAEGNDQ